MTSQSRRGACPEVLHPMETGDGLLVRLPPRDGALALEALRGLCRAARAHGNGIVEVTRRGNLQVRGLRPDSVRGFADALLALGIPIEGGPTIQTNALAGSGAGEVLDVRPLAAALRARLADAPFRARLGAKVSVIVDGGGALHLDALDADLRLRAEPGAGGGTLHVLIGGDGQGARALGALAPEHAVEGAARLLEHVAGHGSEARARELVQRGGAGPFAAKLDGLLRAADAPARRAPAEPIGSHALRDGRVAVGVGLAFGQSDAETLDALIRAAADAGASALAPAPEHALLALDVDPARAPELAAAAGHLGFVARPGDPRRHISACSGAPACAAAQLPTRALGAALAQAAAALLDGSVRIHVSGCTKGCAHPGPSALALVGAAGGCGLVADGNARAEPLAWVDPASLEPRLERLARWVERAREPGEDSSAVLKRFGVGGIAHALGAPRSPR